ncbi:MULTISPECIES: magnesium/cobalt transporter CorA [Priestia]|jgi:magnesium transporter|uniref:Magnesium transport protein CorA n=2 Tax=Priestia megaterium TaxID=1404 RepID=A0A3D8X6Y6_PRIMG|nr:MULTISPECIES: magnesium/cobalt transporter CorA [Priestia]MBY0090179.1 magnesium/cobalt transporter CorA [Priestia aryabhattai]MBY0100231.1 magnesium/cobalt transporter CorA [Priestia aryabhattai]MCM3098836.1 magnesium/cobalt transporter CorA [Priestia megaterium]MCM3303366.1 magnesium/cobalt transporter CorA [Priestia megaterium]MDH3170711.1 magnesium/cobalt transporter CorA [Priestia megaterium]
MIRTLALTNDDKLVKHIQLDQIHDPSIQYYWIDFNCPSEEEALLLQSSFHFHPLAIEDCFHFLQRPKLDYYEGYSFFVLHSLNRQTLEAEEVDLFIGENYMVTFHFHPSAAIDKVWEKLLHTPSIQEKGISYLAYSVMDKVVDEYFPTVYQIEDELNDIENIDAKKSISVLMEDVFKLRSDLLKIRRTILPMRDLLYRVINSERLDVHPEQKRYFKDVYDHLLKLADMIESNREMTSDMRDNYLSLNSNRMNSIMMTLTVISSIFIPLTFIVGVYGMNFENMPELKWHYGYFFVLGFMGLITLGLILWFKRKGWFNTDKE